MLGTQMEMLARLHLQRGPGGNEPIYWEFLQQQPAAGQRNESGRGSRDMLALERQERRHSRGCLGGCKMRFGGTENRPCGVYRGEHPDQVGAVFEF